MADVELSDVLFSFTSTTKISMTASALGSGLSDIAINGGQPTSGDGGNLSFVAGWGGTAGNGGTVGLYAGWGIGGTGVGGNIELSAGSDQDTSGKGAYALLAGWDAPDNKGGYAQFFAGDNDDNSGGEGGSVVIRAGLGDAVAGVGGSITLRVGTGNTPGNLIVVNLPTADPVVAGALWNDSGALKISAGV